MKDWQKEEIREAIQWSLQALLGLLVMGTLFFGGLYYLYHRIFTCGIY